MMRRRKSNGDTDNTRVSVELLVWVAAPNLLPARQLLYHVQTCLLFSSKGDDNKLRPLALLWYSEASNSQVSHDAFFFCQF
jgi:hypothetical protein